MEVEWTNNTILKLLKSIDDSLKYQTKLLESIFDTMDSSRHTSSVDKRKQIDRILKTVESLGGGRHFDAQKFREVAEQMMGSIGVEK